MLNLLVSLPVNSFLISLSFPCVLPARLLGKGKSPLSAVIFINIATVTATCDTCPGMTDVCLTVEECQEIGRTRGQFRRSGMHPNTAILRIWHNYLNFKLLKVMTVLRIKQLRKY